MRIFVNQQKINDINELLQDPSVIEVVSIWGKEGSYIKSSIDLRIFKTPFGSISLLYGPRQIGKTASLKLYLSRVEDSDTLIFTDCSTILNKADLAEHLASLIHNKTTIILDEVQSVSEWHLALRSLYSEGKLKNSRVWCTGSEARHLLESGERLPGRRGEGKVVFARPWSFREYMDFFHEGQTKKYQTIHYHHITQQWLEAQSIQWKPYWQQYCLTGGIPRAVGEMVKHQGIPDIVWRTYVDWILGSWSKLRTPERSLTALARRLCETLNCRVSFEALKQGTDIQSANTIKTLLDIQEDHFSIHVIPKFDLHKKKFLPSKLKKIYPIDPFIARIWAAIGWQVRRLYSQSQPPLHLDECSFATQTFRRIDSKPLSYLYSETTKSEIDFYFDNCAFELKSNGSPTPNQQKILKEAPQSFVVRKEKLPLIAYLVGEGRDSSKNHFTQTPTGR